MSLISFIDKIKEFIFGPSIPQELKDYSKVRTYMIQGDLEKAIEQLDNIENNIIPSQNPGDLGFYKMYNELFRARIYNEMGKYDQSLDLIKSIQEKNQGFETSNPLIHNLAMIETAYAKHEMGKVNESLTTIEESEFDLDNLIRNKFYYNRNAARLYNLKSKIFRRKGEIDQALDYLNRSIEILEEMNLELELAEPLNDQGIIYSMTGDAENALEAFKRSLEIFNNLDNERQTLKIYNNIGMVNWNSGELDDALVSFQKALKLSKQLDIKPYIGSIIVNIGLVYLDKGDTINAEKNFKESLEIFIELDNKPFIAKSYLNLGNLYEYKGQLEVALDYTHRALELSKELGNKNDMSTCYNSMGHIYQSKGEYSKALEFYEQSLDLMEEIDNKVGMAHVIYGMVDILISKDEKPKAQEYLEDLESIKDELNSKSVDQIYKLCKALILIKSERVVQRAEAQKLFQEISEEEVIKQSYTNVALLRLAELLLQELKISGSEEALNEFKSILDRLYAVTETQTTTSTEYHPTLIQVYLLRSRMALIELEIEEAQKLLDDAYDIAETIGHDELKDMIQEERETLKNELIKYKKMVDTNATLYERLQETQIESYLKKAEKILKR